MTPSHLRPIPEIFIPQRRPKPPRADARSKARVEREAAEARERERREIDHLMRSNTCPWL